MIGREGKLPKPGFGKAIFEYPKRLPSKKRISGIRCWVDLADLPKFQRCYDGGIRDVF
jgi:hypothetical protein